jgi:hypothetical protein
VESVEGNIESAPKNTTGTARYGVESLKLFQKVEDFANWLLPILDRFPKTERLSLVSQMKNLCYEMLKTIIKTQKSYAKKTGWYEVDVQLEMMRFFLRHARTRKYLAPRSYETAARSVAEIGRLIGGLIKGA